MITEEDNHLGWFCVEDDGNQIKKERHPLLVGHMPVTVAKQQEFKVIGWWADRPGRGTPPQGWLVSKSLKSVVV